MRLNRSLKEKLPQFNERHDKVILAITRRKIVNTEMGHLSSYFPGVAPTHSQK